MEDEDEYLVWAKLHREGGGVAYWRDYEEVGIEVVVSARVISTRRAPKKGEVDPKKKRKEQHPFSQYWVKGT